MSRLGLVVLAFAASGCFSSWTMIQIGNQPRVLDEGVREQAVPRPDVRERLSVRMPLVIEVEVHPPTGATDAYGKPVPAPLPTRLPFALDCESTQSASDTVYRSAFRYGNKWKLATATMFVLEAAAASLYYFGMKDPKPTDQLTMGFFAVDALGTAALFFVPRKEIYRSDVRPVTSHVRSDCPAGLIIDIAGETFPVDAAGGIGELGLAALDGWMQAPTAPIRMTYGGHTVDVPLGQAEQCAWNQAHHPEGARCPGYAYARSTIANLEVPMGTLTRIE